MDVDQMIWVCAGKRSKCNPMYPHSSLGCGYYDGAYSMRKCAVCSTPIPNIDSIMVALTRNGWFFTKRGESWCPNDLPDWAKRWKRNKAIANGMRYFK